MSRKRKNTRKRATKQPNTDTIMLDRESGLYFMKAGVHQGRITTTYSGPSKITADDARAGFNDGLYRGIETADDEDVT